MVTSSQRDEDILHAEENAIRLIADFMRMYFADRLPTVEEAVAIFNMSEEEADSAITELVGEGA